MKKSTESIYSKWSARALEISEEQEQIKTNLRNLIDENQEIIARATVTMENAKDNGDVTTYRQARIQKEEAEDSVAVYTHQLDNLNTGCGVSPTESLECLNAIQTEQARLKDEGVAELTRMMNEAVDLARKYMNAISAGQDVIKLWGAKAQNFSNVLSTMSKYSLPDKNYGAVFVKFIESADDLPFTPSYVDYRH